MAYIVFSFEEGDLSDGYCLPSKKLPKCMRINEE